MRFLAPYSAPLQVALCLLYWCTQATAQTSVEHDLPGLATGRAAWADYDGDGDLDLALMGETHDGDQCRPTAAVYRNDGGTLVEEKTQNEQLVGAFYGDLAWADYDGDGDLDLLIAGRNARAGESLRLYANGQGNGADRRFEQVDTPHFVGVRYAAVAWGDIDRDGDLDLVAAGLDPRGNSRTLLYRSTASTNPDSAFVVDAINDQNLVGVHNGDLAWADYDRDGDLDLALAGENIHGSSGLGLVTEFYRNQPLGVLSVDGENSVETPVRGGSLAWADYDDDGNLDLAVSGRDRTWNTAIALYRNQPAGQLGRDLRFAPLIQGGLAARLTWIDYDGDGAADLTATGSSVVSTYHTAVFANRAGVPSAPTAAELPGLAGGDIAWADYDGDGRLELLVLGVDETDRPHTRLYRDLSPVNQAPNPPAQLSPVQVSGGSSRFSWQPGDDAESRNSTYNLRIGTAPGANDILSGALPQSPGNMGPQTHFTLQRDLPPDHTYYWSVQTVDGSLARSPWSPQEQLNIQPFIASQQRLDGLMESAMAWGDYDGDGDPDLVLMGQNRSAQAQTSIYGNRNGTLSEQVGAELADLRWGAVAWADYDNDGDLDLAHSGLDSGEQSFGLLYQNDGGELANQRTFSELINTEELTGSELAKIGKLKNTGAFSDLDWGDFDNDGDLDLVFIGADAALSNHTWVLRNLGTAGFAVAEHGEEEGITPIIGIQNGDARWGDYDNDGDLDLALAGGNQAGIFTYLYRNDASQLILAQGSISTSEFADNAAAQLDTPILQGVTAGGLEWADYDGDGDLDLVAGGITELAGPALSTTLYRNDDGQLAATAVALRGMQGGDLVWGDYDNDQDLDLVLVGSDSQSSFLSIYENRAGQFALDPILGLEGLDFSAVSLADYDGDGDLDLISSGRSPAGDLRTQIYDNLAAQIEANQPPEPPPIPADAALDSAATVRLRWLPAIDRGPSHLTYDLRVGSSPDIWNIVAAAAGPGALGPNLFHRLVNLASGTYYWSVRAVDGGYARSPWSAPQSFTIDTVAPVLAGFGDNQATSEISGFKLNTSRAGIGQSLVLNLVFIDRHSGVDQQVLPTITATIGGQTFPFEALQFTGETWSGQLTVDAAMPSGAGQISVRGLTDNKGNAMAPFDSLEAFVVDTQLPSVVERFPQAGATDVPVDLAILTVVFSKPLDLASLSTDNFHVFRDGMPLPLRLETAGEPENAIQLVLEEALQPSTQYTVAIAAAIRDRQGNRPLGDISWAFSTRIPAVVQTNPPANARVTSGGRRLEVVFSSAVDPSSIGPAFFRLSQDGRSLPLEQGEFLYNAAAFTVRFPRVELVSGSIYEAAVLPGIGGPLSLARTEWRFTTIIPQIASTLPKDGAAGVTTGITNLQATFSGPVARLDPEAVQLRVRPLDNLEAPPELVGITGFGADSSGTLLRFSPAAPLRPFAQYEVLIEPQILGALATVGASWTFSTAGRLDNPARGGRLVNASGDVELYFPPAALAPGAGEVAIQPLDETELSATAPAGLVALSQAYWIDAGSAQLGQKATLTMRYSPEQADDLNGRHAGIFRLDSDGQWQWMGGTVDADQARIRTAIGQLGTYAVFAAQPATGQGPAVADLSCQPRLLSPRSGGFAGQTAISFTLGKAAATSVAVFDMEGHLVRRLADGAALTPGVNALAWDGRDQDGRLVYEGPYVILVEAGGHSAKQIVVVVNGQR
ncbi:MAG: hypothetical protein GKR89_28995 [Candidatus Latescibacteria bacterium]|nr:hypothetical protein [Candidatus Latescibacterota bacterium]